MPSRFFDKNTTTAASAAVVSSISNTTTTIHPSDSNVAHWVSVALPILGVLAMIVLLFRFCYKALREDDQDNPRNHYSRQV